MEANSITELEKINVDGMEVSLHRVVNVDQLYANLVSKGETHEDVRDERIPYWADLWPSAIGLAKHLIQTGVIRNGIRVHEMGCGLGLPGIVAGKLGAEVLFSDYLDDALDFARRNWNLNCTSPAEFRNMDWRKPDPEYKADVLLASDVAYERRSFEFLPGAFRHLVTPGGRIMVSEPGRHYAQPFFESLTYQGFDVRKLDYLFERMQVHYRINVYELTSRN